MAYPVIPQIWTFLCNTFLKRKDLWISCGYPVMCSYRNWKFYPLELMQNDTEWKWYLCFTIWRKKKRYNLKCIVLRTVSLIYHPMLRYNVKRSNKSICRNSSLETDEMIGVMFTIFHLYILGVWRQIFKTLILILITIFSVMAYPKLFCL